MTMTRTVFWDMTSCSLVEVHRCFGGRFCIYLQARSISRTNTDTNIMFLSLFKNTMFRKLDCLRPQVKPTQLGAIDRASPYL
jgi:hypothetical protein